MNQPVTKRRKILEVGRRVKIDGLSSEAGQQLNGQLATVIAEEPSGRVTVELDGGIRKALKSENLVSARLPRVGGKVELFGLQSAAGQALNGRTGIVTDLQDGPPQRWMVKFEDGCSKALKSENLLVLNDPVWGLQLTTDGTALQGRRPTQEDRHVQVKDLHKVAVALQKSLEHLPRPCAMFSVYDGHLGSACSDYVAKHMHSKIVPRLAKETDPQPERIKSLLTQAFSELDEEFLAKHHCNDGSTGIVALLVGADLFVAGLGDSVGVLCDITGSVDTFFDFAYQKPNHEQERQRIIDVGGMIVELGGIWRCAHADFEEKTKELMRQECSGLGVSMKAPIALAVSRSFGDRAFKFSPDGRTRMNVVSGHPDVEHVELVPGKHRALVIVSDGVTEAMSLDEVCTRAISLDGKSREACSAIVTESHERGSGDNITVITVYFDWNVSNMV